MTTALQILIFGYIGTVTVILVIAVVVERRRKIWDKIDANKLEENLTKFRETQTDITAPNDLKFLQECRFPISFYAKYPHARHEVHDTLKAIAETKRRLEGRQRA